MSKRRVIFTVGSSPTGASIRRRLGIALFLGGGVLLLYCMWASHRVAKFSAINEPQPFPYPDHWLVDLHAYYDAQHPPPAGSFKLHGEWERVRETVLLTSGIAATICLIGLVLLLVPAIRGRLRSQCNGFPVLFRESPGATTCTQVLEGSAKPNRLV